MTNRRITSALTIAALAATAGFGFGALVAGPAEATHTITNCATEDSENCLWNADLQGNGEGNSFIDLDGNLYVKAN